ncbi:lytic transglycosylase domain-containing protein [Pseudarthrobacter scleromae]|uniref:aggregation-promoting factor C-terminal-like domain-containing protein n=1 Tax=Pseudarthrobacter scleromae TaxID=158897 RepID=UPI00363A71EB
MCRFVTKPRARLAAALLSFALVGTLWLTPAGAAEVPPGDFPSWEEVQDAKESEAKKAAEIARIGGLLSALQDQSEAAGSAAVQAAAEYAVTDAALQAASAKVEVLAAQTEQAHFDLVQHRKELGALAAQSYKTGGTNMGFFVALDAVQSNTVHGLNVVQIVGDKTAALVHKASVAGKIAAALAAQEQAAKDERGRLSLEAEARLTEARSAQDAVTRQAAEEKQRSGQLTAQLASLKGTTAEVENAYRQGQAALAAYEASQAAKRAAAEGQSRRQADAAARPAPLPAAGPAAPEAPQPGGPAPAPVNPAPADPAPTNPAPASPPPAPAPAPPSPPPVVVPSLPGGAVNDPAGAKSYASTRLGAHGWGQDQFLCLAQLWTKESNWLTTATNPYSGAYGIAQALPPGKYSSAGADWLTSYRTQIDWGLGYIRERYGSPCAAWNHSMAKNWY